MMKTINIVIILSVVAFVAAAFYGQRKYAEHQTEIMVQEQWERLTPEQKAAAEAKVYGLSCKGFMDMVDCGEQGMKLPKTTEQPSTQSALETLKNDMSAKQTQDAIKEINQRTIEIQQQLAIEQLNKK
jgi:hypothetical protein